MAPGGLLGFGVEFQPETVGQPGQVIENTHDVTNFQACGIVEAQFPQRPPVPRHDPCGGGA